MKKQMNWKTLILTLAILLMANILVMAKDAISIEVTHPLSVSGSQISPGSYNLSWVSHSPDATVTFKRNDKIVATANARIEERDSKYSNTEVVYQTNPDGSRTLLEVRLGGRKQVLVFGQ